MGLRVRLAARARRDLRSIRDYHLQQASARSAERVRVHLMDRILRLSNAAFIGVPTGDPKVRILQPTQYPYRIYYAVRQNEIVVLHIRHTARQEPDDLGS